MILSFSSDILPGKKLKIILLTLLLSLTLLMIFLGGVTRLTGSGLSMVDWKIIRGILPPLSDSDWQSRFQQYQQFPEYQLINSQMTLQEFKSIFYYEYLHRILGRIIGGLTVFMLLFLHFRKKLSSQERWQYLSLTVLVSVQGLVGWYMVQSGLIDVPQVSHYRLAIHLLLALIFLSYSWLLLLQYLKPQPIHKDKKVLNKYNHLLNLCLVFFVLQTAIGAFLAGLDGALTSNTYPTMHGAWIPPNLFSISGDWIDKTFNNPLFLNFAHRHLGVILALILLWTSLKLIGASFPALIRSTAWLLLFLSLLQPILGISILIMQLPVSISSLHQVSGVLILGCLVCLKFYLHRSVKMDYLSTAVQSDDWQSKSSSHA